MIEVGEEENHKNDVNYDQIYVGIEESHETTEQEGETGGHGDNEMNESLVLEV